ARPEPADRVAVPVSPHGGGEPQRRTNDQEVVDLVEIPLVEQEFIERLLLAGELRRQLRSTNVELPGDDEADRHHQRRSDTDQKGNMVHLFKATARKFE